jgi:rRNA-processing protein FCF1
MPEQVTVTWQVSLIFNRSNLDEILAKYRATEAKPTNQYQVKLWRVDGLTITLYEKSMVLQGNLNDMTRRLLQDVAAIEGLSLDQKNADRLAKILPRRQNAILCPECGQSSFMIEASISGLDVLFRRECGHANKIRPPLMMLNSRILPDISLLVSKALSRFAELGYFIGFEILIPDFIMNALDFLGREQKEAASSEIHTLRRMEQQERLKIINYKDGIGPPPNREQFQAEEDNRILDIAHLTNSILVTCDRNLRDKALVGNRPVVYVPGEILGKLKIIEEVRNP